MAKDPYLVNSDTYYKMRQLFYYKTKQKFKSDQNFFSYTGAGKKKGNQGRIQNTVEHLSWRFLLKYWKKLHLRCSTGSTYVSGKGRCLWATYELKVTHDTKDIFRNLSNMKLFCKVIWFLAVHYFHRKAPW